MEIENKSQTSQQQQPKRIQCISKEIKGKYNIRKYLSEIQFLESMGAGTFGRVIKAWNMVEQKFVAVKITDLKKKKDQRRCENEVFILKEVNRIQSVHIPQLYEYFEDTENNQYYIVMQLAQCSLQNILETSEANFTEYEAMDMLDSLSKTLFSLQSNLRVACCDIKPANLIFSSTAQIMLCDFGHAVKLSRKEHSIERYYVGSPSYMAPEVRKNYNKFKSQKDLKQNPNPELQLQAEENSNINLNLNLNSNNGEGTNQNNVQNQMKADSQQQVVAKVGKITYDPFLADVYSLGVTLLVLIGWNLKDVKELVRHKSGAIREQNLESISGEKYPYLIEIIKGMLSKQSQQRYDWQDVINETSNYFDLVKKQGLQHFNEMLKQNQEKRDKLLSLFKTMPVFKNKHVQHEDHRLMLSQAFLNYQACQQYKEAIIFHSRSINTYHDLVYDLTIINEYISSLALQINKLGQKSRAIHKNALIILEYNFLNDTLNAILKQQQNYRLQSSSKQIKQIDNNGDSNHHINNNIKEHSISSNNNVSREDEDKMND